MRYPTYYLIIAWTVAALAGGYVLGVHFGNHDEWSAISKTIPSPAYSGSVRADHVRLSQYLASEPERQRNQAKQFDVQAANKVGEAAAYLRGCADILRREAIRQEEMLRGIAHSSNGIYE